MPQGLAAIGAMAISALSGTAVAATVTLTNVVVGVATSALVGAAVGGLTAAVTGGDIGKGMLFGAVGGVVTAGLGGEAIAGALSDPLGATVLAGEGMSTAGQGAAGYMTQHVGAEVVKDAGGGILGSIGGKGAESLGGQLALRGADFLIGGLSEEPDVPMPYQNTKEGYLAGLESAEKIAGIRASAGGGSSSHAPMPWPSTKEGAMWTLNKQGENRLAEIDKTYKMQRDNTRDEWKLRADKFSKAAKGQSAGGRFTGPEYTEEEQAAADAAYAKAKAAEEVTEVTV